jgi:hypothetical protein
VPGNTKGVQEEKGKEITNIEEKKCSENPEVILKNNEGAINNKANHVSYSYKAKLTNIKLPSSFSWPKEIEFTMENIFSNIHLIQLIIKWRKHLIILILATITLSVLFSCPWFIKPKFKSTAILYPSNLMPYSDETPTELMLQIFESDEIRDSVIGKFDLAKHYDIDTTKKYYYTSLIKEFASNVNIKKTEYESVIVEIYDTDPDTACEMVKGMVHFFNVKARSMQREKMNEVLVIAENRMNSKKNERDSLQNLLTELRTKFGILDYKTQTKELMKTYYNNLAGRELPRPDTTLTTSVRNLKNKGGEFLLLSDMFSAASASYTLLQDEYEVALRDVIKDLTYTNYVTSPVPADKKSYPIRWLIVTVTTLTTLFLAILIIILIENIRKKEKEKQGEKTGA